MRTGLPATGSRRPPGLRHPLRLATCLGLGMPLTALASTGLAGEPGARADWAARGVEFDAGYTVEAARVMSGGERRASAHAGQLAVGGRFDLARAWGWHGLRAQVSLTLRDGDDVAERAGLETLLQSQEVYGRGAIVRLGSLWLGRRSADGRVDVKLGRLAVGDDFNRLDCTAMHLAFCGSQPAVFAGDYWFNSPLSQWGGVLDYRLAAAGYLRAGVYQVNPRYADARGGGLRFAPSGTTGTLTPLELGWEPSIGGRAGRYAIGGWYSSAPRADAARPATVRPGDVAAVMHSGAHGGWASVQQQLTLGRGDHPRSGLHGQLAFARGDRRTGTLQQMFNLQLVYTGPTAARPEDRVGLGLGSTRLNPRHVRAQPVPPGGPQSPARAEQVAEVFYGWRPAIGLEVQPGVQYVRHPGGLSARGDAVVLGLKADLRF